MESDKPRGVETRRPTWSVAEHERAHVPCLRSDVSGSSTISKANYRRKFHEGLASSTRRALGCAGTTPWSRFRHSASITDAQSLGVLPPGAAQGIASLGRNGIPNLPPRRSSVPCRSGDPPPFRSPLLLAPPGLGDGQGCSAALRSNPSQQGIGP